MGTKFLITAESNNRTEMLKKKIIQHYIANGDTTIAELCKEIDLSIPTVTKLIGELQEDGYILDFGKQDTNGGRKPNIYGLNPDSGYFIGVDVMRDRVHLAAVDFKGGRLRMNENISYKLENTREALDVLCEIILRFIHVLPVPRSKILAIGVNISGRVNPMSGYSYSIFYFEEKPLAELFEERLGIKTYVENDSRAMTYGEYMQGGVQGEKNVLFLNLTWGLGLGIIVDGRLYYGKSGFSGEFGHFCLFDNEILCHCGKKGCLETEASGAALYRHLVERHKQGSSSILAPRLESGEPISLADLIEAIQKEDVLCIDILEQIALNLGKSIAGLINIFNPELVVLGGALAATGDYIRLPIRSAIKKYSLNLVSQDTEIKLSRLQERAGVIGACLLSRSKMLGLI